MASALITSFTDREDDWYTLLSRMKAGMVVPVVGPDAVQIDPAAVSGNPAAAPGTGAPESLYQRLGRQLAGSVGETLDEQAATWPLFAAVGQMLAHSAAGNESKLRSRVARCVSEAVAAGPAIVPALKRLVEIDAFSLFVSLTCDDLLPRALEAVDRNAYRCALAIRMGNVEIDIPAPPPQRGVYQLLGSAANPLDLAIHDGDAVEYLYWLQSEQARRVRTLLSVLRERDLLLIGCSLPDWLGRSLLRLASKHPLPSKSTQDYLCGPGADPRLTTFLSRHSPQTVFFEADALAFIEELATRWERVRLPPAPLPSAVGHTAGAQFGRSEATVFVSYASEDAVEARSLADQLLELGAGDVWLDKHKLRGGDDWGERIEEAIDRECTHFIPVLSQRADERREGVFWIEWERALRRDTGVADRFLLPTVIDAEPGAPDLYKRIGREKNTKIFFQRHMLRAPGGVFDEAGRDDLRRLFTEWSDPNP